MRSMKHLDRLIDWRFSRKTSMFFGISYFLAESAQAIFLIPLLSSLHSASEASRWALLSTAMPLVNLAFAGYASLLIAGLSRATAEDGIPPRAPSALMRAWLDSSILLVIAQAVLVGFGSLSTDLWSTLIFLLAGHLRLAAMNCYLLLNGTRRIGLDKLLQAASSLLTAALGLFVVLHGGGVFKLALAVLAGSALQFAVSFRIFSLLKQRTRAHSPEIYPVARTAAAAIWFSQIGGFLCLGIEIPIARDFLTTEHLAQFAFASRAYQAPLALIGLWCQINTPFWAQTNSNGRRWLELLWQPVLAVWLGYAVISLAPFVWNAGVTLNLGLGTWIVPQTFWLMVISYSIAGTTILLGSYMLAIGVKRHLFWISICAFAAPITANGLGYFVGSASFYWGFLLTNSIVLLVHLAFLHFSTTKHPD